MLTRLAVKDFAIAAAVEFDLAAGLGVISGETGAGKSLLVDALLLLSGQRADPGVVRHGAERAELSAEFRLAEDAAALAWLRENELDDGLDCQLRRVVRADGGSRAWINGRPATAGQLAALAEALVEIHGQHEHQALLDRVQQTRLLDGFGGHEAALEAVRLAHVEHREARRALEQLDGVGDPAERIAYLQHQLGQFAGLRLAPEHIDTLIAAQRRQAAARDIAQALEGSQRRLADEGAGGARAALRSSMAALARIQEYEPAIGETLALLESAGIQLDEAAAQIDRLADRLDLDAGSAEAIESELGTLHELARRHRVELHALQQAHDRLAAELEQLQDAGQRRGRLQQTLDAARRRWDAAAAALSEARRNAAQRLQGDVDALLGELGMGGGRLVVELESIDAAQLPQPGGAEKVELLVSANPGQPPRPLRKVASGGELSRISLAIEVATFGGDGVPCMVFDEVDSGIGGAVAEVVGQKLRALAAHRQVLCVTHLPQVAAQGHYHYRVSKQAVEGVTSSRIERLDKPGRIEELSRMLGGIEITAATRKLASQMLAER